MPVLGGDETKEEAAQKEKEILASKKGKTSETTTITEPSKPPTFNSKFNNEFKKNESTQPQQDKPTYDKPKYDKPHYDKPNRD